jgi:hypothetical protein
MFKFLPVEKGGFLRSMTSVSQPFRVPEIYRGSKESALYAPLGGWKARLGSKYNQMQVIAY